MGGCQIHSKTCKNLQKPIKKLLDPIKKLPDAAKTYQIPAISRRLDPDLRQPRGEVFASQIKRLDQSTAIHS